MENHFGSLIPSLSGPNLGLINKVIRYLRDQAWIEVSTNGGFRLRDPMSLFWLGAMHTVLIDISVWPNSLCSKGSPSFTRFICLTWKHEVSRRMPPFRPQRIRLGMCASLRAWSNERTLGRLTSSQKPNWWTRAKT
jgi:hypothetical protein